MRWSFFLGNGQLGLVLDNLLFVRVHKVTAIKPGYKSAEEGAIRCRDLTHSIQLSGGLGFCQALSQRRIQGKLKSLRGLCSLIFTDKGNGDSNITR